MSGIRSGTSSAASLGAAPTVPDGGISSAGSEYGGLPLIWLFWRVSERVMPIVVKMFVAAASSWTRTLRNETSSPIAVVLEPDVARPSRPLVEVLVYVFTTVPLSVIVYALFWKRIS